MSSGCEYIAAHAEIIIQKKKVQFSTYVSSFRDVVFFEHPFFERLFQFFQHILRKSKCFSDHIDSFNLKHNIPPIWFDCRSDSAILIVPADL